MCCNESHTLKVFVTQYNLKTVTIAVYNMNYGVHIFQLSNDSATFVLISIIILPLDRYSYIHQTCDIVGTVKNLRVFYLKP